MGPSGVGLQRYVHCIRSQLSDVFRQKSHSSLFPGQSPSCPSQNLSSGAQTCASGHAHLFQGHFVGLQCFGSSSLRSGPKIGCVYLNVKKLWLLVGSLVHMCNICVNRSTVGEFAIVKLKAAITNCKHCFDFRKFCTSGFTITTNKTYATVMFSITNPPIG